MLDVRTAADFDGEQGHIRGALNLPLEELPQRLADLGDDPERPIALVCRTDRRSAKAAALLAQRGFAQVQVVQGGMTAWLDHGWPVERNPHPTGVTPMKTLLILNDPPYGTERSFNGLRLAKALAGKGAEVTVFLMADAVACAKTGQKVPQGYYNLELMTKSICRGGEVLLCGTCMDARGLDRRRAGGGGAAQHPGRAGRAHPGGGAGAGVLTPHQQRRAAAHDAARKPPRRRARPHVHRHHPVQTAPRGALLALHALRGGVAPRPGLSARGALLRRQRRRAATRDARR